MLARLGVSIFACDECEAQVKLIRRTAADREHYSSNWSVGVSSNFWGIECFHGLYGSCLALGVHGDA